MGEGAIKFFIHSRLLKSLFFSLSSGNINRSDSLSHAHTQIKCKPEKETSLKTKNKQTHTKQMFLWKR